VAHGKADELIGERRVSANDHTVYLLSGDR
jgi:hypothetical protein